MRYWFDYFHVPLVYLSLILKNNHAFMVTGCLNIQAVVPFSVYKWRFIYIWSCNPHMSVVYTSNDTRKPSTFVRTLLNFSFALIRWSDGHLINWSVFAARAWDTLSIHLLTVPLSTPIVSLTTCRKLPDAKYLKAMRTCWTKQTKKYVTFNTNECYFRI